MSEITQVDLAAALDRIGGTIDGVLLYRYLQKALCGVPLADCSPCALRLDQGRRMFASELMGLMARAVRTHSGPEPVVIFALAGAKPRADSGRGAGRRITADTFVAGWDDRGPDAA